MKTILPLKFSLLSSRSFYDLELQKTKMVLPIFRKNFVKFFLIVLLNLSIFMSGKNFSQNIIERGPVWQSDEILPLKIFLQKFIPKKFLLKKISLTQNVKFRNFWSDRVNFQSFNKNNLRRKFFKHEKLNPFIFDTKFFALILDENLEWFFNADFFLVF